MKLILSFLFLLFAIASPAQTKVAFLSDVHFQDIYGTFSDNDFSGVENPKTGHKTLARTMDSQLHSTRLFNENYFAFLAALDDIVSKKIKIIVLPGDFTDDGQAFNLSGIKKIMETYEARNAIRFYTITGNHDPVAPFRRDGGKNDFLGSDGLPYSIISNKSTVPSNTSKKIITKDMAESGYAEILVQMKDFGFFPDEKDRFWQTPFSKGSYENYTYKQALEDAQLENREYKVVPGYAVPDLSYIVEVSPKIWLMAIDGNTYIPKNKTTSPSVAENYSGAGIGYNKVLTNKTHLEEWAKKISEEADKHGKILIAFTHYPMLDYNDGASPEIQKLLGADKWQMNRLPADSVGQIFSNAGIKLHFAGHMHINDTGIRKYKSGKALVNVQVPSLAAYIPAYKILTVKNNNEFKIETIVLKNVPHFDELFPLYEKEFAAREKNGQELWNRDILKAKSYKDFTEFHLKELVRLRLIPSDWPKDFIAKADHMNSKDIFQLSGKQKVGGKAADWNFTDLLTDLYKFQSADALAFRDIPKNRVKDYRLLNNYFKNLSPEGEFQRQFKLLFSILDKLMHGEPSVNFKISFKDGIIKPTH